MRVPLRTKFIAIFCAVTLVPLVIVLLLILQNAQERQQVQVLDIERRIAEEAAQEVSTFLRFQFRALDNVNLVFPEAQLDSASQEILLDRILLTDREIYDISVTDREGQETARKHQVHIIQEEDLRSWAGEEAFQEVQNRGLYIGPLFFEEGRPFAVIGRTIETARREFGGAIFATVDMRVLAEVVARISAVGEQGQAYVIDAGGTLVAHPNISHVLSRENLSHVAIAGEVAGHQGEGSFVLPEPYTNDVGEEVLGAAVHIVITFPDGATLDTPWFVVAEQPADVAFAPVRQITVFILILLAVALLFAVGLGWFFSRRIVSPIETLHTAAKQYAEKKFTSHVEVESGDEIEDLADQFNTMSDSIRAHVEALARDRLEIEAERNKLAAILRGVRDAVVAVDEHQRVILFNNAAEELVGIREEKAKGRPLGELFSLMDNGRTLDPDLYAPVAEREDAGEATFRARGLQLRNYKGREYFVDVVSGGIRGGVDVGLGSIVTLHDVTRDHFIERMKFEFVTIAAHQLRTPLTAVRWGIEKAMKSWKGDDVEGKKEMETAYQGTERVIQLVNDLLDAARLEEGRFLNELVKVEIGGVIQEAVERVRNHAKKKSINVAFDSEHAIYVCADAQAMYLALENIIENAVHYTPDNGTVTVRLHTEEGEARIEVSDTGVGIPKEKQERIFTKFFRGEKAMLMSPDGSGMGLFITKNIVESHQGRIWFDSIEGKGTTFTIALPLAPQS